MKIKIATPNGMKETEAYATENPSVVIHRTSFKEGSANESAGLWGCTHLPSGLAFMAKLPNEEVARCAARYYSNCGLDLEGGKEAIQKSAPKEFIRNHREIREAARDAEDGIIRLLTLMGANVVTE